VTVGPRFVAEGTLTRVRAFTRRDVDRWLAWPRHSDPLFSSFDPPTMSGSMRDAWYDDVVNRQGQLPFAIEDLDRAMVGRIFLRHVRPRDRTSILGIDLDPRCLGRGYGTDALRALLGYYFGPAGFRKMYLSVASFNVRARRSYERCGFRYFHTHWDVLKTRAKVLEDPRYEPVRDLFRMGPRGLEAQMKDMVADASQRPPARGRPRASASTPSSMV
jgi:diamine N-acetyltransferase